MRVILITDLHIGTEGEDTYGIDVRQNFLDIRAAIQTAAPDHIVIAGDLCYMEADSSTYEWIKGQMDELSIPYDMIVGNHDDSILLAEAFDRTDDLQEGVLFYKKQLEDWTCLFLDTAVRVLSDNQLQWLETQLASTPGQVMIFMHHPPLQMGVPFMDSKHALDNMEAVQAILLKDERLIPVFSGHYHVEKTACKGNIVVQVTPACYFQIGQEKEEFELDHTRIAYREITLEKDTWRSTVRYFEGNKLGQET